LKARPRTILLASTVALLVAANLWRFPSSVSPARGHGRHADEPRGAFRAEDFVVHALPGIEAGPQRRDLFRFATAPRPAAKPVAKGPPPPLAKTPEQLAVESAQAELGQIRCVGAAFHKQRAEAFLIVNGRSTIVQVGEKAGGRFVVEAITRDSVLLRDPATGTSGRITISGQP
jgi:hypothetical protein